MQFSEPKFDPADGLIHHSLEQTGIYEEVKKLAAEVIPMVSYPSRTTEGKVITFGKHSSGGVGKHTSSYIGRMGRRRRREEDDERRRRGRKGGGDDYDRIVFMRPRVMMAYAIDVTTWEVYVGYSGGGSAVASNILSRHRGNRMAIRLNRVRPYLRDVRQRTDFAPENCAEVAALNVAISHGAQIGNLFFISMDSEGHLRNPCANCIQWITQFARGYYQV